MRWIKNILILVITLAFNFNVKSQIEATISLDTNTILVGDQIYLHLNFTGPKGIQVHWPALNDTIISEIEIIAKSQIDTTYLKDKSIIRLHQAFRITSFDSGYYAIPPIRFDYQIQGEQLNQHTETHAILLNVHSVPVDVSQDIRDIKEPLPAPFTFREALPWIIALILLGVIGYFIYYFLKKRKKAEPVFRAPVKIKIPPHQVALDALENLRVKKLWQAGQIKEYHTELTDIIRDYIYGKFNIHAPELTSDEILNALNHTAADTEARQKLNQTFVVADLVKFAKMQPLPMEHDASLNNAIDFVKATMFFSTQAVETDANDGSVENPAETTAPVIKDGKEVKDV